MKVIGKAFEQPDGGTLELELLDSATVIMSSQNWHFDNPADLKRLAVEIEAMLPPQGELS
jgi:hypothetical protein